MASAKAGLLHDKRILITGKPPWLEADMAASV